MWSSMKIPLFLKEAFLGLAVDHLLIILGLWPILQFVSSSFLTQGTLEQLVCNDGHEPHQDWLWWTMSDWTLGQLPGFSVSSSGNHGGYCCGNGNRQNKRKDEDNNFIPFSGRFEKSFFLIHLCNFFLFRWSDVHTAHIDIFRNHCVQ